MYKCEVIGADLHGNRSTEDYPYYKDLEKDPEKLKVAYEIGRKTAIKQLEKIHEYLECLL